MRRQDLIDIEYKRILICYEALAKYHIGDSKCTFFFEYFFHLSDEQVTRILRNHSLSDYNHINLSLIHIDLKLVDLYAKSIVESASKQQLKKFKNKCYV